MNVQIQTEEKGTEKETNTMTSTDINVNVITKNKASEITETMRKGNNMFFRSQCDIELILYRLQQLRNKELKKQHVPTFDFVSSVQSTLFTKWREKAIYRMNQVTTRH